MAARNAVDRLIEQTFYRHAQGVQVPILSISTIFAAGRAALASGNDLDEAIKAAIALVQAPPARKLTVLDALSK